MPILLTGLKTNFHKVYHLSAGKTANFLVLLSWNDLRIHNNFNGFSMIDVHQNATLSESFEGDRSRVIGNRCKQRRRRRQWQRHETIGLMSKNSRSASAFYILVHFFAVLCKTTTWNDHI